MDDITILIWYFWYAAKLHGICYQRASHSYVSDDHAIGFYTWCKPMTTTKRILYCIWPFQITKLLRKLSVSDWLFIFHGFIQSSIFLIHHSILDTSVAYFTYDVNQSVAKPPLNFNGGLAELGLTSVVNRHRSPSVYVHDSAIYGFPCHQELKFYLINRSWTGSVKWLCISGVLFVGFIVRFDLKFTDYFLFCNVCHNGRPYKNSWIDNRQSQQCQEIAHLNRKLLVISK